MLRLKLNHVSKRGHWWPMLSPSHSCQYTATRFPHNAKVFRLYYLRNSLYPSGCIWRHRPESTLARVIIISCYLATPSHYLLEAMLTSHQLSPLTFIYGQFHKRYLSHESLKLVWKVLIKKFIKILPRANELNLKIHNFYQNMGLVMYDLCNLYVLIKLIFVWHCRVP